MQRRSFDVLNLDTESQISPEITFVKCPENLLHQHSSVHNCKKSIATKNVKWLNDFCHVRKSLITMFYKDFTGLSQTFLFKILYFLWIMMSTLSLLTLGGCFTVDDCQLTDFLDWSISSNCWDIRLSLSVSLDWY